MSLKFNQLSHSLASHVML